MQDEVLLEKDEIAQKSMVDEEEEIKESTSTLSTEGTKSLPVKTNLLGLTLNRWFQ